MVNRTRCKWRATIDVKSVCRHSGSLRRFEFRVTSVQNNRGSGHRLNNGTGVIFGMIYFCRWLAVTNKGAAGEFLRRGSNFREDGSFGQFILIYTDISLKMNFSLKGGGVNHMKPSGTAKGVSH